MCVVGKSEGALWRTPEPGNISQKGFLEKKQYVSRIMDIIEDLTGKRPGKLITIGHQIGNYELYPKFPWEMEHKGFDSRKEMALSYNKLGFDGIELDVQLGPELKTPYIIHERITDTYPEADQEWKAVQSLYENNSLEKLLKEFIEKRFYKKRKRIYIELKAKHSDIIDQLEEQTIDETLKIIERLTRNHPDAAAIRKEIAFISFNHLTLQRAMMHEGCRPPQADCRDDAGYQFYYLAVSNQARSKLFSRLICPEFNDAGHLFIENRDDATYKEFWDMLNTGTQLTGIWFLPGTLDDGARQLSRLNDRRENYFGDTNHAFEFYLSTYQLSHQDLFDAF